ncbi:MAG: 6-carboxytetrahydropterin synthase QueD [Candidatus Thermoplasmatota archaeon]|nr:6-carboxytetrahydropterin synthase QueD [Candidatus Thermoplasmatota archaeon]
MRVCREFTFDAAHFIPQHPGSCKHPHGHTYKLEVVLDGEVKTDGMVVDFGVMKDIVHAAVLEKLDHRSLNDLVDTPTAEHILQWIATQLQGKLPVYSLKLWEGQGKWAELILR